VSFDVPGKHLLVVQRMSALERANAVRLSRARLRRDVATGRRSAQDVILDPPAEAVTATVGEMLAWQRGWGSVRVERFLAELGAERLAFVSPVRALGDVTLRERSVIARRLASEFGSPPVRTGLLP
jgi:hypothetical protein